MQSQAADIKNSILYTFITVPVFLCLLGTGCRKPPSQTEGICVRDDSDTRCCLPEGATRIISLYPAHTENLFSLGLSDEIIGVYKGDEYPPDVEEKRRYDYCRDPEEIIAAAPDLVLIRPFIKRAYPDFVTVLERNGILVVSLYPETVAQFEPYMRKLGRLTGRTDRAKELIDTFYTRLEQIQKRVAAVTQRKRLFFEATYNNYRTVIPDSFPGHAIAVAGGIPVAGDASPIVSGSSLAPYGIERILEKADQIDVYVAQRGAMNPLVSAEKIRERTGFQAIRAVKNGRILVLDEAYISRPTMRYVEGVQMLAEYIYPHHATAEKNREER